MLKEPECECKTPMDYVRVALALEILAYHHKSYLATPLLSNAGHSEEMQALLTQALIICEEEE